MWHFHGAKPWDMRCMAAYLVGAIAKPDAKSKVVGYGENKRLRIEHEFLLQCEQLMKFSPYRNYMHQVRTVKRRPYRTQS